MPQKKKMRKILELIILLLIVCACEYDNGTYRELLTADSLLQKKDNEAAYKLLKGINQEKIESRRDSALYNLLYVQAAYRLYLPNPKDSLLDISINYFKEKGENYHSMLSAYYKGMLLMDSMHYDSAIIYMKEAERLATRAKNQEWILNTQEGITKINKFSGNNNTAMTYAKKVLALALNTDDPDEICSAYNYICAILFEEKENDSCVYYIKKMIPYAERLNPMIKASIFTNIGTMYAVLGRQEDAKQALQKSIAISPYLMHTTVWQ